MTTAYLLLIIDTRVLPPKVAGTAIFGESTPTMNAYFSAFEIAHANGDSYSEARERLIKQVQNDPTKRWALSIGVLAERPGL